MDNYLLLAIIALKGVCIFICWKTMRLNKNQDNRGHLREDFSEGEAMELVEKMEKIKQQNDQMKKELERLKNN